MNAMLGKGISAMASLRLLTAVAVMSVLLSAHAELPDSMVNVGTDTVPSFMIPGGVGIAPVSGMSPTSDLPIEMRTPALWRDRPWEMPRSCIATLSQSPTVASWQGGGVYGSGGSVSMPGMMGVESARLNFSQTVDNVTFTAWGGAVKYGYFRGLQTSYGFGGSLDYRISDRWSVTLFGSYYSSVHPLTPAMAGFMNVPNFGGYASYNINEHWGISVGAQATRSLVTNRWEAQPIVTPYYRFNEKVAIGVDVGGIIYNIARELIDSRHNGGRPSGGPMPPSSPPRPGPPPVVTRK